MLSEDLKNNAAKEVLDTLISLLERKSITDDEAKEIAKVTVEFLNNAQSEINIPQLYKILSEKWPVFKNLQINSWGKIDKKEESEVIMGVIQLIRNGKIDDALKLAKTETEDSI